jgi:hypothetical protein
MIDKSLAARFIRERGNCDVMVVVLFYFLLQHVCMIASQARTLMSKCVRYNWKKCAMKKQLQKKHSFCMQKASQVQTQKSSRCCIWTRTR